MHLTVISQVLVVCCRKVQQVKIVFRIHHGRTHNWCRRAVLTCPAVTHYCLVRGSGNATEITPSPPVFWLVSQLPWDFRLSISIGRYTWSAARVTELCKVVKFIMWKPLIWSYRYVHTHVCFDFWNICLLDPGIRIPAVARNCFFFSKTPELLWRPPSLLFNWVSRSFTWGKAAGVCKLFIMSAVPVRVHGIDRDNFTCTLGGRHIFHRDQSLLSVRVHLAVSWWTYVEEMMTEWCRFRNEALLVVPDLRHRCVGIWHMWHIIVLTTCSAELHDPLTFCVYGLPV